MYYIIDISSCDMIVCWAFAWFNKGNRCQENGILKAV